MAAMLTGNMDDGFAEALIRGFKTTFLSDTEYQNMMECESVEDLVLIFQETDYGNFLAKEDDPSAAPDWRDVEPRARAKAAEEFLWVRSHAVEPLATFMDFVTHEYMIELVLELLKLSSSRSPEQSDEEFIADVERTLHVTSHPLGRFDESTAKAITAFGTKELDELCSTVLVETPVGRYFEQYLANEAQSSVLRGSEVAAQISETPIARLEHGVMKIWMEDFRAFAVSLGGETAEVMEELLGARAAAATINITYNSMNTEFGTGAVREEFRRSCFPAFGPLYPEIARELYKVRPPRARFSVTPLSCRKQYHLSPARPPRPARPRPHARVAPENSRQQSSLARRVRARPAPAPRPRASAASPPRLVLCVGAWSLRRCRRRRIWSASCGSRRASSRSGGGRR